MLGSQFASFAVDFGINEVTQKIQNKLILILVPQVWKNIVVILYMHYVYFELFSVCIFCMLPFWHDKQMAGNVAVPDT